MDKSDILGYILILFILVICAYIYFDTDSFQLKCIVSDVDQNTYCVRETAKLELVADLLARVNVKLKDIVKNEYK